MDTRPTGLALGLVLASGRAPGARGAAGGFLELRRAVGRGVDVGVGLAAHGAAVRAPAATGFAGVAATTLAARVDVAPGRWRFGPGLGVMSGVVRQDLARRPDPVWGPWYGVDDGARAVTAPWSAFHASLSLDAPAAWGAWTFAAQAGPAVVWSKAPAASLDVALRVGIEFGGRP